MRTFATPLSVLFFLFSVSGALAAERTNPNANPPAESAPVEDAPVKHKERPLALADPDKRWVIGGETGFGATSYQGRLGDEIDSYRASANASKTAAINLGGYYGWRIGDSNWIVGPALSLNYETFNSDFTGDLTVATLFIGGTIQYYFDSNIKDGFFGRFDLGFVDTALSTNNWDNSSNNEKNYSGAGTHLAFGYAIPLGRVSLPLMLQWQHTSSQHASTSNAVFFTAGIVY
jgi:hypothetical protein